MRLLNGSPCGGAHTPRLVEEYTDAAQGLVVGAYRMTKLDGRPANWITLLNGAHSSQRERHFRQAGETLARFHEMASAMPTENFIVYEPEFGGEIHQVPGVHPKTNDALIAANEYLQRHKTQKTVHGDYHGKNLMTRENLDVTGVVDFGYVGNNGNYLADMIWLFGGDPDRDMSDALPDVVKGYEQAVGQAIDPVMIDLTKISHYANYVIPHYHDWRREDYAMPIMIGCLRNIKEVTGVAPFEYGRG